MDIKVVLEHRVLDRSNDSGLIQRVATVYIDGEEYRVSAPSGASGDALKWVEHFRVRRAAETAGADSELATYDGIGIGVVKAVKEELEKQKRDESRKLGTHPDGIHCAAQICRNGHVLHCDGMPFEPKVHCTKCGAACIDECQDCGEPIHGAVQFQGADSFSRPQFCHRCGHPYPWMAERIQTARELLYHDDKLTMEERTQLWDLLQYVMSNPKDDLTPAKKKLLEIKLEKAGGFVKEAILDLMAKAIAELIKG